MATEPNTRAFPIIEGEVVDAIRSANWDAAWELYRPINRQWDAEYDAFDNLAHGAERDAAWRQFYKVNLPTMMKARDAFMAIPAPNLDALLTKMMMADKGDGEHFDACTADLRRVLAEDAHRVAFGGVA